MSNNNVSNPTFTPQELLTQEISAEIHDATNLAFDQIPKPYEKIVANDAASHELLIKNYIGAIVLGDNELIGKAYSTVVKIAESPDATTKKRSQDRYNSTIEEYSKIFGELRHTTESALSQTIAISSANTQPQTTGNTQPPLTQPNKPPKASKNKLSKTPEFKELKNKLADKAELRGIINEVQEKDDNALLLTSFIKNPNKMRAAWLTINSHVKSGNLADIRHIKDIDKLVEGGAATVISLLRRVGNFNEDGKFASEEDAENYNQHPLVDMMNGLSKGPTKQQYKAAKTPLKTRLNTLRDVAKLKKPSLKSKTVYELRAQAISEAMQIVVSCADNEKLVSVGDFSEDTISELHKSTLTPEKLHDYLSNTGNIIAENNTPINDDPEVIKRADDEINLLSEHIVNGLGNDVLDAQVSATQLRLQEAQASGDKISWDNLNIGQVVRETRTTKTGKIKQIERSETVEEVDQRIKNDRMSLAALLKTGKIVFTELTPAMTKEMLLMFPSLIRTAFDESIVSKAEKKEAKNSFGRVIEDYSLVKDALAKQVMKERAARKAAKATQQAA